MRSVNTDHTYPLHATLVATALSQKVSSRQCFAACASHRMLTSRFARWAVGRHSDAQVEARRRAFAPPRLSRNAPGAKCRPAFDDSDWRRHEDNAQRALPKMIAVAKTLNVNSRGRNARTAQQYASRLARRIARATGRGSWQSRADEILKHYGLPPKYSV